MTAGGAAVPRAAVRGSGSLLCRDCGQIRTGSKRRRRWLVLPKHATTSKRTGSTGCRCSRLSKEASRVRCCACRLAERARCPSKRACRSCARSTTKRAESGSCRLCTKRACASGGGVAKCSAACAIVSPCSSKDVENAYQMHWSCQCSPLEYSDFQTSGSPLESVAEAVQRH